MPPEATPETPAVAAPINIESLALQSAPAIGRSIVTQSGVWGLMFVLLVFCGLAFAYYVIPSHIDKINAGRTADAQADTASREKQWGEYKSELAAERADHRINLENERAATTKNYETLGARIERGFDRLRDNNRAANGKGPAKLGDGG